MTLTCTPVYNRPAMAIDIRPISDDDLDRAHFIMAYSFTDDRSREARERLKHVEAMGP